MQNLRSMLFWGVLWIVNSINVARMALDPDGSSVGTALYAIFTLACAAIFVYYYIKGA